MERANNASLVGQQLKIPSSSTRANRVLMFMENYPTSKEVQEVGLDAICTYARNPDAKTTYGETKGKKTITSKNGSSLISFHNLFFIYIPYLLYIFHFL